MNSYFTFVTRHLYEDVIDTDNPLVQLVRIVGWIIRDGEIYFDESRKAECTDTEETGKKSEMGVFERHPFSGYIIFQQLVTRVVASKFQCRAVFEEKRYAFD